MRAIQGVLASVALACFSLAPAAAQTGGGSGLAGQVALGVGALPDYEGASAYVMTPYLEGEIHDGDYFARFEGGALEANILGHENFHFGPLIGYRLGRGDVANGRISRLPHIGYSIATGFFAEYEHRAQDPRSGERITLRAQDGTLNTQTGWTVALRAVVHRPVEFVDPGLIAAVEGDVNWADGAYMARFFSITPEDSLSSGLPLFHAHQGLESVGAALALDQFLSRTWSVGLRLHYGRLLNDAGASPITALGSPDQFFGALVVGYVI